MNEDRHEEKEKKEEEEEKEAKWKLIEKGREGGRLNTNKTAKKEELNVDC